MENEVKTGAPEMCGEESAERESTGAVQGGPAAQPQAEPAPARKECAPESAGGEPGRAEAERPAGQGEPLPAGEKTPGGTGVPGTYAQQREEREERTAEAARQYLVKAGVDPEAARRAVETVRQERARAFAANEAQAERAWELERTVQERLDELKRAYPECGIETPEQLRRDAALCEKAAQLQNGSLVDAYVLLHHEEMRRAAAAAARQEAINAVRSAEHLHAVGTGGHSTGAELSEEEYEGYRLFGFSREEAARAHKKLYGR